MGSMPVEGPLTTTGLQVVETLWAYDGLGLEPSGLMEGSVYVTPTAPPCGEAGRCLEYGCGEEETPEILVVGTEYDAYHGWYYFQTTATCYVEYDGEMTMSDAVNEWLAASFCAVTDTCYDPASDIVMV